MTKVRLVRKKRTVRLQVRQTGGSCPTITEINDEPPYAPINGLLDEGNS